VLLREAGVSDDLAKRLGEWAEDATAARYDHAERVEELRAAEEKAKQRGAGTRCHGTLRRKKARGVELAQSSWN